MAAIANTELVNIVINDVALQVPKGELIVESVKRLGLEIPIFCYHSRMKPVGMCRMCLVDVGYKQPDGSVRKMPKPQTGCSLPAGEGMVIYTDTEQVHKDRKGVLEFLLINHPLDCPICDRGGECPLQNNTIFYGPSTSRFTELKRHAHKAFPLSKYVTLDLERCIHCGRCVRFTEEISGDSQLAFRFRGADMQPSTFQLTDFDSKFSGNVIEICPVGALTSAKYRFRARPWDLESKPSTCTECANHCSVFFDYRAGKFVRINGRTNEAINAEWTCDNGKFGHDYYNSDKRITKVLVRKGDEFKQISWSDAYPEIVETMKAAGKNSALLVGKAVSNEGLYLAQRVFRDVFGTQNLDHRMSVDNQAFAERLSENLEGGVTQSTISSLESAKTLLVFGADLATESPMVHLRVRKAWLDRGAQVIVVSEQPTDVDNFAQTVIRYKSGMSSKLAEAFVALAKDSNSSAAVEFASEAGVSESVFRTASSLLNNETVIITTRSIYAEKDGAEAAAKLAELSAALGAKFNIYAVKGNDQGATDMGILPDQLPGGVKISEDVGYGTEEILQKAANFKLKALWLIGCNPFDLHPDRQLVINALESVDYLVVQDVIETEAAGYASVLLPMAANAEQDGTYTNNERRIQKVKAAIVAPGDARPAWRTFAEILVRENPGNPYFNAGEIQDEIATVVSGYPKSNEPELNGEGVIAISKAKAGASS